VSEDLERLAAVEAARVKARDRKLRGPKVIMDNPGLRKATMEQADRLRRRTAKPEEKPGR